MSADGELAALALRSVELVLATLRPLAAAQGAYQVRVADLDLPANLEGLALRLQDLATYLRQLETLHAEFRRTLEHQVAKAEAAATVLWAGVPASGAPDAG